MSKFTERLEEVERRASLIERWAPIVDAAGFLDGTVELTPEDTYLLAGSIMRDKEVARLARTPEFENRETGSCVVNPDFVGVLASMSDGDRVALRARIRFVPSPILRGPRSR